MVVHRGVWGKILSTLWILERNYANLDGMPQKCIEMLQNPNKIDFPPDGVVSWGGSRSQLGGEDHPRAARRPVFISWKCFSIILDRSGMKNRKTLPMGMRLAPVR